MNRNGIYILFTSLFLAIIWLSGCKQKQICPAYQSAFYLDKTIADEEFSPFDKDSMPKLEDLVKKTDVLLIVRLGKKKTDKRMAVIPMITIFPEQSDSALALADSLGSDSTLVEEEEMQEGEGEAESEVQDSTEAGEPEMEKEMPEEIEKPKEEQEEGFENEDIPKPKKDTPQPKKKIDPKDPEISDPGLKAEFEESFGDEPKLEDLNEIPESEPEFVPPVSDPPKKKKGSKKGVKKEVQKPKEEEPAPEDDKF